MKKISLLLTIIISIIISISSVYALDISIDNTSIFDKSNTITVTSVSSSGLTIIPNITFNNINDYIILKVKFKGKSLSNYNIKNISDNNNSEYIKTSYKYKDTLDDPIYITMKYDNGANSDSSLNNINIIMDLEDENGNDNQVVINNQSTSNTSNNSKSTTVAKNPQTGLFSYIIVPIILVLISLILIRYYTKYKEDNTLMILILFLLVVPLSVMAYESHKLGVIIKTDNVIIKKSAQKSEESKPSSSSKPPSSSSPPSTKATYVVYLYPNGGTGISEGQKFEYTETTLFSKFPSVSKTNCTLDGWNLDSPNGEKYYSDVRAEDNGKKLYARWNCQSDVSGTQGKYYAPIQNKNISYYYGNYGYTAGCPNNVYHDITLPAGVPVYAGMDGTAEFIQNTGIVQGQVVLISYGNQVKITNGSTVIIYGHLSKFSTPISNEVTKTCPVPDNTTSCSRSDYPCSATCYTNTKRTIATKDVKKGDLIGYTGTTGNSTGAHLHVEIREGGTCVCDPYGAFGMRKSAC